MGDHLDDVFCRIVRDITDDIKKYPKPDQKTIVGWLQQVGKEVQTDSERRARNEYGRYLRYIVQSGEPLPGELKDSLCTPDLSTAKIKPAKSVCPRKDVIAQLQPGTDLRGIAQICEDVRNGEITTAAEFVYAIAPYVADRGTLFREVLDRDLSFFRQIVDETVDQRVQDEADVMMHTQNDIKQKFHSLTDAMVHRTMKIRQRLLEISPKFDWAKHGKNKAKVTKLLRSEQKRKGSHADPNIMDKLLHQVFMRGQWLKKELARLQEENANLKMFLGKFRILAAERKEQESHVPRMLCKEKNALEHELECLQEEIRA
ncbi:uncharacterized protein LOC105686153 isoform X2 [Athalia rosae]|uniref:uncharacterized protein LOC105686153 isoform X2 n=1 Tax=Athalia rosae TaxID=37344 RepID=UPI0020335CFB|nr:uncharacterized protein LOC105686153 isoform X2 [Athalia rosae]